MGKFGGRIGHGRTTLKLTLKITGKMTMELRTRVGGIHAKVRSLKTQHRIVGSALKFVKI